MSTPPAELRPVRFDYDEGNRALLVEWADGVTCPTCGSSKVSFLKNQLRWQCSAHHAKRQFSVKVGTIFEDSPLGLDKWLPCVWLITNAKNGISSYEVGRALGVTQKTAWFMLHRVRLAHQGKDGGKLGGKLRWKGRTAAEKSAHARLMVAAREAKRAKKLGR